ncbi:MAG: tyrosine-type recombinase/integrase [Desulfobulbaceae bacterium]|nr:tyrosine-type recombinase/integrase [Desulfobulbaceae bacterium]
MELGTEAFWVHGIRHLTASLLVAAGVPLVDVQAILRHKRLTTTARYVHQLQSLRSSLSVLEGRKPRLTLVKKPKPQRHIAAGSK